jgi:DNA repair exonuclease SbcCD ATPase subunit
MKKFTSLAICLFIVQSIFAQAYDGTAEYLKKSQAAVMVEYKYPQEIVEAALKDKLERQGLKLKNSKSYMIAYNSLITGISSTPYDYAFMVDKKSKREKEITLITLVINATGEVNASSENSAKAKTFLNELSAAIDAANVNAMYDEQEKALAKAQKKYKNLQEDQENLEKKKRNLEEDLRKNAKDQTDQQAEVKRQQEILDAIKAKKK